MNRTLVTTGLGCGLIVFAGFLMPWLDLKSAPYLSEGTTFRDHLEITGLNLATGRIQVVQRRPGSGEIVKTLEIQVESKTYPNLDLVGAVLLVIGGVSATSGRRKPPYAIIIAAGLLAFAGGCLGLLDYRWVRHPIVFEDYTVYGYFSHGLVLCITGSLLAILACALEWGLSG